MLVLNVICQTQPAKLVLTFETCHMITTLVFLDRCATFWARFSEGLHPGHVFWFSLLLGDPFFDLFTCCRCMIFLLTLETGPIATRAIYDVYRGKVRFVNDVVASFARTPVHVSIFLTELLTMPLQVFLSVFNRVFFRFFNRKVSHEETMGHNHITVFLHTFEEHTFWIVFDRLFQIVLPANFVECMAANKFQWLVIFVGLFIITVADCTWGVGARLVDIDVFCHQTLIET